MLSPENNSDSVLLAIAPGEDQDYKVLAQRGAYVSLDCKRRTDLPLVSHELPTRT
jgi:hypothetical protein